VEPEISRILSLSDVIQLSDFITRSSGGLDFQAPYGVCTLAVGHSFSAKPLGFTLRKQRLVLPRKLHMFS
jgi:hypothetical protein